MNMPFAVLVKTDGTRRVCVMNCGPSTSNMRSRADMMRECTDCEDHPCPPPDPRVRIVDLELEVASLRSALRNVLCALDAGATKASMRCSLLGALSDSYARRG